MSNHVNGAETMFTVVRLSFVDLFVYRFLRHAPASDVARLGTNSGIPYVR